MYKPNTKPQYDDRMDPQCIPLCDAINRIHGIETFESCCGHGERKFVIFFLARSFKWLALLDYCVAVCHSGVCGWQVISFTDCSAAPNRFLLEGPTGDYTGANQITKTILDELDDK
jgi:hypothetical protein